jgi:microcystin-dependent protein
MSKFRSFYPFDFQLLNENGEHALFIEDQTEKVTLSITNKGNIPLNFRVLNNQSPGAGYYHFKLHFRPGTLTSPENIKLNQENWLLAHSKFHGMDVLCFTLKDDVTPEALQIESGGELKLPMTDFLADRSTGSRETSVELISDHLYNKEDTQIIKATRLVKWPVINHRGNATLPVHVGIVGSNTILNNGVSNKLTLRVSLKHHKDSLTLLHHVDDSEMSKIIISFDEGPKEEEWNIAEITTSHSFKLTTNSDYLNASKNEEGYPTLFTVTCKDKNVMLGRYHEVSFDTHHIHDHFDIKIDKIITNHPSGTTNCYVRFENIPGYWDNSFIVPIEKQPMIMRGDKVGIGKEPEASLDIAGGLIVDGKAEIKNSLDVLGNVDLRGTVEIQKDLKVEGRIKDKTGDVMPVGAIIAYGGTEPPLGWLLCDGAFKTKSKYPNLYDVIKTNFGVGQKEIPATTRWGRTLSIYKKVPDENTFGVPDLRSRFIVGAGKGPGLSDYPVGLGKNLGAEKHVLIISEMPTHKHDVADKGHNHINGTYDRLGIVNGLKTARDTDSTSTELNLHSSGAILPAKANISEIDKGGNQPHNNLPPYYALTYIIKY